MHGRVHAAGTWNEDPAALEEARMAVASANIVVVNLLFIEDQVEAIMPILSRGARILTP